MLSQLYIQNIAVIEKVQVAFEKGLNVFTGETGAGKSIVIDAINAVLGNRTSRDLVRTGAPKALVTALFEEIGDETKEQLLSLGFEPEEDGSLLLSREIAADGKTSCKIGGRPATVSILREVAQSLINIHGQHDNQSLLMPEQHLGYIDQFGKTNRLLLSYRTEYAYYTELQRKLRQLQVNEQEKEQKIDLLTYQINEITAAGLYSGEEEELLTAKKRMQNIAKIVESLHIAHDLLSGGDETDGVLSMLDQTEDQMRQLQDYYPDMKADKLMDIRYELEEISESLREALSDSEVDPQEMDRVEERLDLIFRLKRKYGNSIDEILAFGERAQQELDSITRSEEIEGKLRKELEKSSVELMEIAGQLSEKRQAAAQLFQQQVCEELAFLDMPSVRFLVHCETDEPDESGIDRMEFYITTNPGEPPKPIGKVASGGELSRIMLSLKNVIAEGDRVGTLIFDEVDTGVSGRAAQKIGRKLKQASGGRQIICVTHLAQVAAFADTHLLIAKNVRDERTFTTVQPLSQEERVQELARIMGGENITEPVLASARELILQAKENENGR
ncbi:MAG: DNA repair protein RecN [Oscillospiraceae bacterium]|nr:DNA repair protein RecN [Oscillospiraceae bacterium]MBQ3242499.1 DNA repair protein RecN [Oscillospiraceae bacterium]MBR2635630.1 DNA repair protein RecN [Oscillospiraceae bacterium]